MAEKLVDFGEALKALKEGKRVARQGWNGKGMFIFMRPADTLDVDTIVNKVKSLPKSVKDFFASGKFLAKESMVTQNTESNKIQINIPFTAYLCMYAADGSIVNGWLASQTDILSYDWVILD